MKQDKEVLLMKGNEAIAHAAIRCGCDGYFGYPITPQSEILETLAADLALCSPTIGLFDNDWDHKYVQGLPVGME